MKEKDYIPTQEDFDAVLDFLPMFEQDTDFGEWRGGEERDGVYSMPSVIYSDQVHEFYRALYDHGWVFVFDWTGWRRENPEVTSREFIATASVQDIRKLFTAHIRNDRFCEGHLL